MLEAYPIDSQSFMVAAQVFAAVEWVRIKYFGHMEEGMPRIEWCSCASSMYRNAQMMSAHMPSRHSHRILAT